MSRRRDRPTPTARARGARPAAARSPAPRRSATPPGRLAPASEPPAWRRPQAIAVATVVVVVAVLGAVVLGRGGGGGTGQPATQPAPAEVVSAVTALPASQLDPVGDGGVGVPLSPLHGAPALTGAGGRPQLLYVGAEYCPFCAAQRWSMAMALSRFGTLGGLRVTTSSSSDAFADTHTLSFYAATYQSTSLDFQHVELQDRDGNDLQSPSPQVQTVFDTYDRPPYTAREHGIPFVDIGGRYVLTSTMDPGVLAGKDWSQVAAALHDPSSAIARQVIGYANWLTAGICATMTATPTGPCADATVTALVARLPH